MFKLKFMRKILLLFTIMLFFTQFVRPQCNPNFLFTTIGLPGVYPPEIIGLSDGFLGVNYSQTLTLIVLEDTMIDLALFLPDPVVAAMNLASISTVMALDVNYVAFDLSGLPNGLSFTCDQNTCEYPSGIDGCILINGTPIQGGSFSVPINLILNVQIPPINNIFSGMAMDLPSFPAVEYDLFIDGSSTISEFTQNHYLFPNPTLSEARLLLKSTSDVLVYNVLGKVVLRLSSIKGDLVLSKLDLGKGMFYVKIKSEKKSETIKFIIK